MGSLAPPLLCPRLIGREAELEAIGAALDDATRGRGRTVLIAGEAGIGKTALIKRAAEMARARGARVAVGECVELEAQIPLRPFLDIVASLERQSLLRGVARPADEVARADVATRQRLQRSYALLLAQVGRAAALVAVIEDLHWADDATLQLFAYLARALRDERVILIGTYRSDELHRRHALRPTLAELARARIAVEVIIPRLDRPGVATVVRETLGAEPSAALIGAIEERCDGNPFFIEEVLKAFEQGGQIVHRDGRWHATEVRGMAVPESVRDAVVARLDRLDTNARRTLQVAAVIGHAFDVGLLAQVSGVTDRLATQLRAAIDAQLIHEERPGGSRFVFRHALTREAVLAELLAPERVPVHLAIATAIEATADPGSQAEDLAYHFDAAGDRERARRYHVIAGDAAFRQAAFAGAARHFERAIEISSSEDTARLYVRLADAHSKAGHNTARIRAAEAAFRAFMAAGDPLAAGMALTKVGQWQVEIGDPKSFDTGLEAVRLLEPLGPTQQLVYAYHEIGRQYYRVRADAARAREWTEKAVALERSIPRAEPAIGQAERPIASFLTLSPDAPSVIPDAQITLAYVATREGNVELAEQLLRQGIDGAIRQGLIESVSRGYVNLYNLYAVHLVGDRDALLGEWSQFCESKGFRPATLLGMQADRAFAEGDLDGVLRIAAEVAGETDRWSLATRLTGAIARSVRDGPDAGRADVVDVLRTLAGKQLSYPVTVATMWHVMVGDLRRALVEAENASEIEGQPTLVIAALHAARILDDAAARERWTACAEAVRTGGPTHVYTEPNAGGVSIATGIWHLPALCVDAEAAVSRRDPLEAAALLGRIIDALESLGEPCGTTLVRLRRIEVLLEPDPRAARDELGKLIRFWRKAKATWYLGELTRWAAQRGLRIPPEDGGVTAKPLTAREREVARFVREGLSNREIAERLVISERTAEGHVQHIMDKLGFRSRAQIAAWHATEVGVAR